MVRPSLHPGATIDGYRIEERLHRSGAFASRQITRFHAGRIPPAVRDGTGRSAIVSQTAQRCGPLILRYYGQPERSLRSALLLNASSDTQIAIGTVIQIGQRFRPVLLTIKSNDLDQGRLSVFVKGKNYGLEADKQRAV